MGAIVALAGVGATMWFNHRSNEAQRRERRSTSLRDEVAVLLGEEATTKELHADLFYKSLEQWTQRLNSDGGNRKRGDAVIEARAPYIEHCAKLRQLAIRITLFADDPAIVRALDRFRDLQWNAPMKAAHSDESGVAGLDAYDALCRELASMFGDLEAATWMYLHPEASGRES